VLQSENIPADTQSLRWIARAARGSMRDALSLTDQAIAYGAGQLQEDTVRQMLGTADRSRVLSLIEALAQGDGAQVVALCDALRPMTLPPKVVPRIPATSDPTSGASGTASKVLAERLVVIGMSFFLSPAQPLRALSSSTRIEDLLRNSRTRMARPMADSAAATVRMKNTNTWPCMSPR